MNEMHSNVETSESDDFSGLSIDELSRREFLIGSAALGGRSPLGRPSLSTGYGQIGRSQTSGLG